MKNYVKPVVLANEELAEGVYAASGGVADCWTIDVDSVQDWGDSNGHVFSVRCVHSTAMEHISTAITVAVTFSATLDATSFSDYPSTVSGNKITVRRELLADGYKSGDNVEFKIYAKSVGNDQANTKALYVTGKSISCQKEINVQGGGASEI